MFQFLKKLFNGDKKNKDIIDVPNQEMIYNKSSALPAVSSKSTINHKHDLDTSTTYKPSYKEDNEEDIVSDVLTAVAVYSVLESTDDSYTDNSSDTFW